MGKVNLTFRYTSAADSAKPHYLRDKFIRIRRQLAEQCEREQAQAAAQASKVTQLKKGKP